MRNIGATLRAAARAIEANIRPLFAPAMIAAVLVVFLALTFGAASLIASLLGELTRATFLILWGGTTAAGVALVRLIPRILK